MRLDRFLCSLSMITLALSFPSIVVARPEKVALTFDDLPALTILKDQPYVNYLNATISPRVSHTASG